MHVLIVDDSRSMRMILRKQLVEAGFQVTEAGDGQEALRCLREQGAHFDLALFDWNMPVMSGIELLGQVRADPTLCVLPVLMVTSETELDYVARALELGANEYLMKPFTPEALKEKLELIGLDDQEALRQERRLAPRAVQFGHEHADLETRDQHRCRHQSPGPK